MGVPRGRPGLDRHGVVEDLQARHCLESQSLWVWPSRSHSQCRHGAGLGWGHWWRSICFPSTLSRVGRRIFYSFVFLPAWVTTIPDSESHEEKARRGLTCQPLFWEVREAGAWGHGCPSSANPVALWESPVQNLKSQRMPFYSSCCHLYEGDGGVVWARFHHRFFRRAGIHMRIQENSRRSGFSSWADKAGITFLRIIDLFSEVLSDKNRL